ncbi:MAG: sodium:calcium antiporter [Candidatus Bathyarchaeota archaeon]|nr:MAG: sodium:calcium antiporter [Candidatus Bathyarchaeota archaeon]
MTFDTILLFIILIVGTVLLVVSSEQAVEHSISIAKEWGAPQLLTGLVLVSLGTDLPEIMSAMVSCAANHAVIGLGGALGSALTQMTLVMGLLPFLVGEFRVKRGAIIFLGACEVLALVVVVSMAEKGYFTRTNAVLLLATWPILMFLTRICITAQENESEDHAPQRERHLRHIPYVALSFLGVAAGAYMLVQSVIELSAFFHVSEFLISFFLLSIGTSLPELAVDTLALRRGQNELAIGDLIGSSIIDVTVVVGIGQFFCTSTIPSELVTTTGLYSIIASTIVVLTAALREKIDRKAGALFIVLYLISYITLVF